MKGEISRYRAFHGGKCPRCSSGNTEYEIFHNDIEGHCMTCSHPFKLPRRAVSRYRRRYNEATGRTKRRN